MRRSWVFDNRALCAKAALAGFFVVSIIFMLTGTDSDLMLIPTITSLMVYLGHGRTTIDAAGLLIEEGYRATVFIPLEDALRFETSVRGGLLLRMSNGSVRKIASLAPDSFFSRRAKVAARVDELNAILEQARALV